LSALPELRDVPFVAAVYDRRHFPALTERRYKKPCCFATLQLRVFALHLLSRMADMTFLPNPPSRRSRRLRIIGIVVLVLGVGGAGVVYWMGTRAPDYSDDLSMVGYGRAQSRQMARLYGQSGLMIEDLFNNLKRPGIQATIIVATTTLFAFGCFYLARFRENDSEPR
jgi:hypothetical protein